MLSGLSRQELWDVRTLAHMGEKVTHTKFWQKNVKEVDHLEELRVDGMTILKHVLKK
jgi:hypothetical protein